MHQHNHQQQAHPQQPQYTAVSDHNQPSIAYGQQQQQYHYQPFTQQMTVQPTQMSYPQLAPQYTTFAHDQSTGNGSTAMYYGQGGQSQVAPQHQQVAMQHPQQQQQQIYPPTNVIQGQGGPLSHNHNSNRHSQHGGANHGGGRQSRSSRTSNINRPMDNRKKEIAGEPVTEDIPEEHYCNLFAAPIPKSVRNDDLLKMFQGHPAVHASVMMDVNSGRSKGFGFITFEKPDEGRAALAALNGTECVAPTGEVFKLALSPSKHTKKCSITESRHVYFRNIPTSLSHDEIVEVLGQFGKVTNFHVKRANSQDRWLLASVDYATVAEAKCAVENGHGKILFPEVSQFPVMTKFADNAATKSARRDRRTQRRLENQQAHEHEDGDASSNIVSSSVGDSSGPYVDSMNTSGHFSGTNSEYSSHHQEPHDSGDHGYAPQQPLGNMTPVVTSDSGHIQLNVVSLGDAGSPLDPLSSGPNPDEGDHSDNESVSSSSSGKYRRNPYGGSNVTVAVE